MEFRKKLKTYPKDKLWNEYCGFLDLSLQEYMYMQNRLMQEQIELFRNSGLGRKLIGTREFSGIDEFRAVFPLTRYEDYAEILLAKQKDMLPSEPEIWIETTWEGGFRPIKLAPYSRAMLNCYRNNAFAIMMIISGRKKGDFNISPKDRILYGGAPLPYMTGLLPSLLDEEMRFEWLPDNNAGSGLSFSKRIKQGFKMAFGGGVDYFFAIGSVANYITEHFGVSSGGGDRGGMKISPKIAMKYLKAKRRHKKDGGKLTPGDVFDLKGFVVTGTDGTHYQKRLAKAWGVTPIEICAGTELTLIGTDTWENRGMCFFPDACFYEFIPESELLREEEQEGYVPRTCLMDGVRAGELYELVISVLHGGAFMRYRIGDMFRCVSASTDGSLPRFTFHDRVWSVIDIAGFTRITEASVEEVIRRSGLKIGRWVAKKEYDENDTPYMQFYLELEPGSAEDETLTKQALTEHMALYFKYFDSDYSDLKKLLEMEPLRITILKKGTIRQCEERIGKKIRKINPMDVDLQTLTGYQSTYIPSILKRQG